MGIEERAPEQVFISNPRNRSNNKGKRYHNYAISSIGNRRKGAKKMLWESVKMTERYKTTSEGEDVGKKIK